MRKIKISSTNTFVASSNPRRCLYTLRKTFQETLVM